MQASLTTSQTCRQALTAWLQRLVILCAAIFRALVPTLFPPMDVPPALKRMAGGSRSFSDFPQHLQLAILAPPFKVSDRLRQRRVSREMRDIIDSACFYVIWGQTDFSPSEREAPISRATFRAVIRYLCDCANQVNGQRGSAAEADPGYRRFQLGLSAKRRAGEEDLSPARRLVGRFAEISNAQCSADKLPISFQDKPEMVLNVSGLQNTLWFDDLFDATGKLSEFWALNLVANGWEGKTGMYSLSHFLYRRVQSVRAECLVVEKESDWEPVLERVRGIGEAMSRLSVLSLRTGEGRVVAWRRAEQLGEALRRSQTITSVTIENLDVQNSAVLDPILRGLAGIPTLERLRLCHVAPPGVPAAAALGAIVPFMADAREKLTQLELSGVDLEYPSVLDSLFEGLARNQTLRVLKLPAVVRAEKMAPRTAVRLLEPNLGLETLDLQTAHLNPAATCLLAAYLALNPSLLTLSVTIALDDSVPLLLLSAGLNKNRRLRKLNLAVCIRSGATREGYQALVRLKEENGARAQLSCCPLQLSSSALCPHNADFERLCRPPGPFSLARLQSFDVPRSTPPGRPALEQLLALKEDWITQRLDREIDEAMTASRGFLPPAKRERARAEGRSRRALTFVKVFELLKDGCPEFEGLALHERPVWACGGEGLVLSLRVT
ncbi:hypothetical protein KFL_003850050 [Klebsormidium nitens]|uniref:Uncharacterized protein n=1 Tax=Klebsormidium nitens TaxID=105231 RepID=A0A1Y1IA93_KLENI|nr:hypothetical protein KFL_003850050 [Klebsormidium nitens]|eukprot:GAQ87884.1 hypothetical protein KFL_003850050 [Klebsormidium nitens]